MTDEVKSQLDKILKKQEFLLRKYANNPDEVALICGTWSGFLAGMKLTRAISYGEYISYYNELTRNTKKIKKLA